jgi:hypothetical protein
MQRASNVCGLFSSGKLFRPAILQDMRFLPLLTLLAYTTATATPLLTTKASVAEGNFCKTYVCSLKGREVILPETLGILHYSYFVKGGTLIVNRESNMSIVSTFLNVPVASWNKPIVNDFLQNFIGLIVEPNSLRKCVRLAAYTGSSVPAPLISGTQGGISFSVDCRAEQAGYISITILDKSFEPH